MFITFLSNSSAEAAPAKEPAPDNEKLRTSNADIYQNPNNYDKVREVFNTINLRKYIYCDIYWYV